MHQYLDKTAGLILHFRTPDKTLRCIHSLVQQGLSFIILVDNSEDSGISLSIMQPVLRAIINQGIQVHTLTTGQNQGFAKGVNMGFGFAQLHSMDFLLLINSDAYFETTSITPMFEALSQASICIPKVKSNPDSIVHSLFGYYQKATAFNYSIPKAGCVKYASGCCQLIKIKHFKLPFLEEDFFFYGEDIVLGYYTSKNKLIIVESSKTIIIHEGNGSAKNGSLFYEYHINRGHLSIPQKLTNNNIQLSMYLFIRCITLPVRATIRSIRYGNLTAWRGLVMATTDILSRRIRSLTPLAKLSGKQQSHLGDGS
jgi:GT2 family glycosyltransferase